MREIEGGVVFGREEDGGIERVRDMWNGGVT